MKILTVEDDQHISNFLSATLSAHRYAVDAIEDGAAGLEMATQWSYDLILLDILLPKLDGIEVCRRLRAQGCQTPILMLTVKDSNEDVIAGLDAGADDYVAKSCDPSQLLARVRALLRRGGNASSSPVLTWGPLCLDPALVQVTYNQKVIHLRAKEYSLLELFLRHPRHILCRSAIIDHLWSIDDPPVEGSVTNLIKDLRQRLKSACQVTDLIETVYGLGYRLKAAPTEDRRRLDPPEAKMTREEQGIVSEPVLALDSDDDWDVREQRGKTAIHKVTQRFRVSLEQRIAVLEAAQQALLAGKFSSQQQIAARTEAHKLAGGLGTFGCMKASKVAQAIESFLAIQGSQGTRLTNQLSQLVEELKQELAELLTYKDYGSKTH
ncbi:MAG: response regulator [Chroococcidiopsidaceae cyanobacterium CP_BM_ER_R8_30]|nr:response regulator [Chroococcidiopsidaceae cyanobacterium CP_BM_ER_R8_30]